MDSRETALYSDLRIAASIRRESIPSGGACVEPAGSSEADTSDTLSTSGNSFMPRCLSTGMASCDALITSDVFPLPR